MATTNLHRDQPDSELHVGKGFADGHIGMIPYKQSATIQAFAYMETIGAAVFRQAKDVANATAAPPTEADNDIYVLDSTSGDVHANWDGAAKEDWVIFDGTSWIAVTPSEGMLCYDQDANQLLKFDGTNWVAFTAAAAAGGSNSEVQYNSSGGLAGITGSAWDAVGYTLTLYHIVLKNIASATGEARFLELSANGTNYVGFKAPDAIGTNKVWELPAADGSAGQLLKTSGAGVLSFVTNTQTIAIAASDETTALTTGTAKATFRMPYAYTLTEVRISVTTAPTGSVLTVDINETGSTILSTKLTIDVSEKTSTTAATAAVVSDAALADDAEITIDIDTIGSSVAGAGLKVYLIGYKV